MSDSDYQPDPRRAVDEWECLEFWREEFVQGDEQRAIWLDAMLKRIEENVKGLGGYHFGRLQAAQILFCMFRDGWYPPGV
jgi:hypothetical protein